MPQYHCHGQQLHYLDEGNPNGFPLLLGHSYLWDSAMWAPQIAALKQQYRCIVPELWGHGRSDNLPADKPLTMTTLANDHHALMQSLGLARYAVVGLSVGGMWGIELALKHPEAVAALAVLDSDVGEEPAPSRQQYFQLLAAVEQSGCVPEPVIQACTPIFLGPATRAGQPELVAQLQASLRNVSASQVPTLVRLGRMIFSRQSRLEHLTGLNCPLLFAAGSDDIARPFAEAERMAKLAGPNAELVSIPDAGHISALEQPEAVTDMLERFLTQALS
ncbi:alpha/beta fold hydrolase [Oceanimonas sp. CHS3-5]|uniref:alpha/beta fold hydrolase n=1 Tax=Oceanimonas sp. CHS3-5 TaxID=3068186 RepID=UPI00273F9F97|nr:alpha/beta fold hydrolase [Oceanimonas sp. CHS3-5]MDP5291447.1 alpha/beta fold hydrolase [Oceanimonas sp. CHS3-5]